MGKYATRRLLQAIPTLLGVTIIGFMIIHIAPGDPVQFFAYGIPNMTAADISMLRHQYGLDQPLMVQYLNWFVQLVQLDLGRSFVTHQSVKSAIGERLLATLLLTGSALLFGTLVGVFLGVVAGLRSGGAIDSVVRVFAVAGNAIPGFWLGLMVILLFSVHWHIVPSGSMYTIGLTGFHLEDRLWHLAAPMLVLSLGSIAVVSRFMRTQTLEVVNQDYVRTARTKGLAPRQVTTAHVLRNALLPLVTILGGSLPGLFSGAVIVEYIFSWPGMGRMAVDAAFQRDYPILMGLLFFLASLVILGNLLSDVAYGVVDPRISLR
jgi:peptide/nickel transport system permease protein